MFENRTLAMGLICGLLLVGVVRTALFAAYACDTLPSRCPAFNLEGVSVHFAWRAQEGAALYPEGHSYPYAVNLMGPFYFWTVGLLGRIFHADLIGLTYWGRTTTFLASLAVAMFASVFLFRRHGPMASLAGACLAFGSAPTIGFAVMTRPDMLAEMLGIGGFFLAAYRRGFRSAACAGILLGLAILTKQTTGVYALAAALAVWFDARDRRRAIVVAFMAAATALVPIGLLFATSEPHIVTSLLGQGKIPFNTGQRLGVLWLLARWSPDILWFALAGCWLWAREPFRDRKLLILAVVLLVTSVLASAKLGSDMNYFLGLRLIEILAVGTLCKAAIDHYSSSANDAPPIPSGVLKAALAMGLILSLPSVWHMSDAFVHARRQAEYSASAEGRQRARRQQAYVRMAENPDVSLLSDSNQIAMHQRDRVVLLDPYLFRVRVATGQADPSELVRRISSGRFDVIVLSSDVNSASYPSAFWRLPAEVAAAIRTHYRIAESDAGYWVYTPFG